MRASPLNYLLALTLAGGLWILAAFVLGNYLLDNVALVEMTVEEFVGTYRTVLTVAGALCLVLVFAWFHYGSRPSTAGEMPAARRRWDISLMAALGVGVISVILMVLLFGDESFSGGQYALFVLALSVLTWLQYWLSTLLWSPRTVMNVPRGRR